MEVTAIPEVGRIAPDFRLQGPGGAHVTLSEYRGQRNVVLVFFPLAFSPVCSHQLPDLERRMDRFRALGAEVLGISVDSHYANEAFAKSLHLSFPLLSDFRREATMAYGLLNPERHYSNRALLIVDKRGVIVYRDQMGDPDQEPDPARALAALERLAD
jgi:peroxiredoxin